jgi:hypothetical protein
MVDDDDFESNAISGPLTVADNPVYTLFTEPCHGGTHRGASAAG